MKPDLLDPKFRNPQLKNVLLYSFKDPNPSPNKKQYTQLPNNSLLDRITSDFIANGAAFEAAIIIWQDKYKYMLLGRSMRSNILGESENKGLGRIRKSNR